LVFSKHFFIALFLSLTALVSACQSPGNGYLMNGIGAELPARDIASATKMQNAYFNYLCQQAGLTENSFSDKPGGCNVQPLDEGGWTLIVRQGMNDIDRRCDAYLEWLDNQRRSKGPVLSQIRDVQTATTAIMTAINPGSGAALDIVVQAFGLLSKSVENYQSRLLLAVESSTVNSVVLNALHDFRVQVKTQRMRFANRPDAEYALREYMRRCLPFAIESQINDLSTLGSQGRDPIGERTVFQEPVGFTDVSRPSTPATKVGRVDRKRTGIEGAGPKTSEGGDQVIAKNLQKALCISPTGNFSDRELAGIKVFEDDVYFGQDDQSRADGDLDKEEQNTLLASLKKHACPSGYKNYVESFSLFDKDEVARLRAIIRKKFDGVAADASLHAMRPSIQAWRDELGLNDGKDGFDHDEATHNFLFKIGFFG
jgi:hypothetical protein